MQSAMVRGILGLSIRPCGSTTSYWNLELNRNSPTTPARRNDRKLNRVVSLSVFFVIGVLVIVAVIMNRGLHIEVMSDRIGVTLEPAQHESPTLSTRTDASPIVTAPEARVVTKVRGATKPTPLQDPPTSGMSTTGAASPIVTGQGAVVTSTVDTRP